MNGFARRAVATLLLSAAALGADQAVIESVRSDNDVSLTVDPSSSFWHQAHSVILDKDKSGTPTAKFRTEVRTRWTKENLYFLFICPYEELYLKPSPTTKDETYELWNWDVAEVFIGSDFQDIQRYKEFEVSPQGEWIDLDINLHNPHHEDGWKWNSGFKAITRVDKTNQVWYAAMRIPMAAIDKRAAAEGNTLRINLFLSEGPPGSHHEIAWQAPMKETFHAPEKFGLIRLVKK